MQYVCKFGCIYTYISVYVSPLLCIPMYIDSPVVINGVAYGPVPSSAGGDTKKGYFIRTSKWLFKNVSIM